MLNLLLYPARLQAGVGNNGVAYTPKPLKTLRRGATIKLTGMPAAEASAEPLRDQLDRILSSPGFARNERLAGFLRFVVEQQLAGKAGELKESVVGVEVFGRKPDYSPRRDPVVRMEAAKLRARLAEYYAAEGLSDPVIIELPKGGYVPVFHVAQTADAPAPPRAPARLRRAVVLAALGVVLAATLWWWMARKNAAIDIAVLPLENVSHNPADDYLADGLTDELIRNLSVIDGLGVRSRTSSFALKGKPRNVREAGRQLQVDYVVEGSVLRDGSQLRIDAQLVRVRDDSPVWSGKFDRAATGIFAIQDEIAQNIVNNLRLKLGRGRRRYETSVEAYDLYLRAREYDAPRRNIPLFEQAIAKDPFFAPAWAGLASTYAYRSNQFGRDNEPGTLSKMRTAAEKAIQLDPLLAEAHDALALSYARDGEWKRAEQSFRRAIELDPNRAATYEDFVFWFLRALGRNQEAVQLMRRAQKADPLSTNIQTTLGLTLIANGQYDEAASICLKSPADNGYTRQCLARARLGQGKTAEAIQILTAKGSEFRNRLLLGFLGYAYARSGRRDEAEKIVAASSGPNTRALVYAGLGNKEKTLAALEEMAAAAGPQRAGAFLYSPELAFLRDDPRLKTFRRKIGLPD